jgi:phosphatidylinositol-3,4,5-trisphosphate 3-phosphatase/dual-specificity protein phosphatase PTEN
MGWIWFIPCFHLPQPPSPNGQKTNFKLMNNEIDFPLGVGATLVDVELNLGWDLGTIEDKAPRESEMSQTDKPREPGATGVLAAVTGNVEALQAARD